MRNVIINADDYAMDAGVDAAILRLAGLGAVTATSAMVLSPALAGSRPCWTRWPSPLLGPASRPDQPLRGRRVSGAKPLRLDPARPSRAA